MKITQARIVLGIAVVLATLAGAPAPAKACELICLKTKQTYDGNLGGLAGADAKCDAEYPGFRFARGSLDLYGIPGVGAATSQGSWMGNSSSSYADCSQWTSTAGNGGYVTNSGGATYSSQGYGGTALCTYKQPLICCNM